MKRLLILLSLVAIYHTEIEDCSGFEYILKEQCSSLSDDTNFCVYSENKCIPGYKECADYKPQTGFDEDTCKKISPSDPLYKCGVIKDGNTLKCQQELKECKDYTENDNCYDLKAGEGQRCDWSEDDECEAFYNECSEVSTQSACEKNIPLDDPKKCIWAEVSGKPQCIQYYSSCSAGDGNEQLCKKIKPLGYDNYYYDYTSFCAYSGTKCEKKKKDCEDYVKGEDDDHSCMRELGTNENKKCIYDPNKDECSSIYPTCESYNSDITKEDERNANDCQKIIPRYDNGDYTYVIDEYSECKFDITKKECVTQKKDCTQLKSKELCENYIFDNEEERNKFKCIFLDNGCKKIYKTCELYNANTEQKNQNDCESIPIFYEDKYYMCEFKDQQCTKKAINTCEDYKDQDESICSYISGYLEDSINYKCIIKEGKCTKVYNNCNNYGGDNSEICEAIIPKDEYHKCVLDSNNKCINKPKICTEYTGKDALECSYYQHSSKDKSTATIQYICAFENNKCIEKTIYLACEGYKGTNENECKSIQLSDQYKKCVYNNGCKQETKKCEDIDTESLCLSFPETTYKKCVYDIINKKCFEQYKTCELYQNNKNNGGNDEVTEEKCQSMIISSTQKCKYGAPSNGGNPTCITTRKTCTDLNQEMFANQCTLITESLSDITKKCVFENKSCLLKDKTCLEMSNLPQVEEEDCKNAKTSASNKVCSLNENKDGCEEKEKEKENKDNSATKYYLSIIMFISLCLLV